MSEISLSLSVVIPTFNRTFLLEKCLSTLDPKVQNVSCEIIVSDDGNDELTKKMIHDKFPFVTWVKGPRKGPAANRNNGAIHSSADWIIFIDDDCVPAENILSTYKDEILKRPNIKALEGAIECSDPILSPLYYSPVNIVGDCFWSCNIAVRSDLFRAINGFDSNFPFAHMEDIDLHRRIKSQTKIDFIRNAIVDHPSRRINSPKKLAASQESHLFFNMKHEEKIISCWELLKNTTYHRLIAVRDKPKSIESFQAVWEYFLQIGWTFFYYQFKWRKKYH